MQDEPIHKRIGHRAMELSEDVIYIGIAVFLVATGVVLLYTAGATLLQVGELGTDEAAIEVLDVLLLLFIVVELMYAVRITLVKRELVAEPFLLIGIIASIKEIVVLSVRAADSIGTAEFDDQMTEVGVLGFLVLLLGVTAWLLRIKEREPEEDASESERLDNQRSR